MQITKATARIYTTKSSLTPSDLRILFHEWIQQDALDELLLDVADYSHVPKGPGVLLVAHECYVGFDDADGRFGLSWRARQDALAPAAESWRHAVSRLLVAARTAERRFDKELTFDGAQLVLGCNDRLHAPHGEASYSALQGALEAVASEVYPGADCKIEPVGEPRQCFRARLSTAGSLGLSDLPV
ncbi:MAG: hypothetical protein VB934_23120 [Polyangiaceae bacterium]